MPEKEAIIESEGGFFRRGGEMYRGGPAEGWLQKINPAFRLTGAIVLLLGISLCREPVALVAIFAVAITSGLLAFLNLRSIYHVMLVPVLFMALPAWLFAAILHENVNIGSHFFIRTLASVSVASVMLHSIGLRNVSRVMEAFHLPYEVRQMWSIMVAQVASFSGLIAEMSQARKARQVVKPSGNMVRVQIGRQAGILLSRTWHRGNGLAAAMDARAIAPQAGIVVNRQAFTARDFAFVAASLLMATGLALV